MNNLKDTTSGSVKEINLLTYVDDDSFVFKDRIDLIVGSRIIKEVMAKWGLTTHAGSLDKKSKTGILHAPSDNKIRN